MIDIKIAATTGADLNHLVRKILKIDFIKTRQTQELMSIEQINKIKG